MGSRQEHWGVVVKPGETLKCDPGELYCVVSQVTLDTGNENVEFPTLQASTGNENVEVFVKVDGNILLMATLSVSRRPQYVTELIFEEEFELLHTSKTCNVFFMGHKFCDDDEIKEAKIASEKLAALRRPTAQSSKPKVTLKKRKNPGKWNVVEDAKGKNRPSEKPLKTALDKKAKTRVPFQGKNAASGRTVHVATPYPSKQVKRSPMSISPGSICKSCTKSFYSPVALEIHRKLKHSTHK